MPPEEEGRNPWTGTAVVILGVSGDGLARPLLSFHNDGLIGVSWFDEPKVTDNRFGRFMVVSERYTGTGAGTREHFFVHRRGRWRAVDSDRWRGDLATRLPEGRRVWKGIPVDVGRMRFEAPLWRDGDANCCPTGGKVAVQLTLEGDRFEIGEFRLTVPSEEGNLSDPSPSD